MPDYCAAICEANQWRLIEDKAKALDMDDKGLAIFVTSIEDLHYELEKRYPAPEHCTRVCPSDRPGFAGRISTWDSRNGYLRVNDIAYVSSELSRETALRLVQDNEAGLNLNYRTLCIPEYARLCYGVLPGTSDFVVVARIRGGWYHVIYSPKKAKRIRGSVVSASRRRLSQGIWPFDTEMQFFCQWREWLLAKVPAIGEVFQPVYNYRSPRNRTDAHNVFVHLVGITRQLRLLKQARKAPFYKQHINLAAQYLPGMMRKKGFHRGIIAVLKAELKALGRVIPKDIPEKEAL